MSNHARVQPLNDKDLNLMHLVQSLEAELPLTPPNSTVLLLKNQLSSMVNLKRQNTILLRILKARICVFTKKRIKRKGSKN